MKITSQDSKLISTMDQVVPDLTADVVQSAVTLSQRTEAVLRGLDFVLEHHNAPESIRDELKKQLHQVLDSSSTESVWLKRVKYALTYPLAKYLRNPLPSTPDLVFKPTGKLRLWMKARINAFNRKNTHLWYSWLQTKRSSLPASRSIINETYEKHFATLTKADPGDESLIKEILEIPCFARLLDMLKKEVARKMKNSSPWTESTPSGSATFESRRSDGGQQAELRELSQLANPLSDYFKRESAVKQHCCNEFETCSCVWTDNGNEVLASEELMGMSWTPREYNRDEPIPSFVKEQRAPRGFEEWQSLKLHLPNEPSTKPLNCTIQGILEPMKVRVISKGEALPYYSCKKLQKAIHSSMRDMDCFRLIGRPFSPTDLIDLAESSEPDFEWFSVDYSAATDGLSWKYSGAIFRKVIEDLPLDQQELALRVLGPHNLHYPGEKKEDGVIFKGIQQNGQLMGSILSFPILCLANLGVYLKTTECFQSDWSDSKRLKHVLINGDDMVYAAPPILWEKHVDIAGRTGLEMSVGKAYKHPVYANVNSTSVHYDLRKAKKTVNCERSTPWQIDFLNVGLFYGQRKVQNVDQNSVKNSLRVDEEDEDEVVEYEGRWQSPLLSPEQIQKRLLKLELEITDDSKFLVPTINQILKGTLPSKQRSVLSRFLSKHHLEISQECFGVWRKDGKTHLFTRNLFLPCNLGGMGVSPPLGFHYKIKKVQRHVAMSCIAKTVKGGLCLSSALPAPGIVHEDKSDFTRKPWFRKVSLPSMFSHTAINRSIFKIKKILCSFQNIQYKSLIEYQSTEAEFVQPDMRSYFEEEDHSTIA